MSKDVNMEGTLCPIGPTVQQTPPSRDLLGNPTSLASNNITQVHVADYDLNINRALKAKLKATKRQPLTIKPTKGGL